jgi:hypothetical protein
MTCIECAVTVKNEEMKLVNKYLLYDALMVDLDSAQIKHMVNDTLDKFKAESNDEQPSVTIKTTMVYQ